MAKLLGIDIGTSACKVLLIDETGRLLGHATADYPSLSPNPGWSEQNPEQWWAAVQRCLDKLDAKPDAIGVTGQMHGAVFLDEHLEVIRPAILWNDQRTVAECQDIEDTIGREQLMLLTGNPARTGFQLPKLLWLRNIEPESFRRIRHVLLPKDYIRLKLTGELWSDVTDASGTGAFDVAQRQWADPILSGLRLDPTWFPTVTESFVVSAASHGVPVVGGGGDQAAAAVGTGAVKPGIVSVSLGTSGVVFEALARPNYDPEGTVHTFCHANGGWHAMGVMLSCGGALRWYRDTFRPGTTFAALGDEAATVAPGANGVRFLPYLTGERCPHNDPFAKAAFAGLEGRHTAADLSRAVFEGISFGLRDCGEALEAVGGTAKEVRVTGGGARSRLWLSILADLFQVPCSTLRIDEGPAFGAAILAGVGVGVWPDVASACDAVVIKADTVEPPGVDYGAARESFRGLYRELRRWNRP